MVRSFDLKSGVPEFKSSSEHYLGLRPASPSFNSHAALVIVYSKLVYLLPVGILNLFCSFKFLPHNVNDWVYQKLCIKGFSFSLAPFFMEAWKKIFALKRGTISKRTKYSLHCEYFVKISCRYRYVKRIPNALNLIA